MFTHILTYKIYSHWGFLFHSRFETPLPPASTLQRLYSTPTSNVTQTGTMTTSSTGI